MLLIAEFCAGCTAKLRSYGNSSRTMKLIARAPKCLFGWSFRDPRTTLAIAYGNSLFDGDYRTSWPHFKVSQQFALSNTLAFLKGGLDQLPRSVILPPMTDGTLPLSLISESISHSRQRVSELSSLAPPSVFGEQYDIICALPSSNGPGASASNLEAARAVSRAFGDVCDGDSGPSVEQLVLRVVPMAVKSTELVRSKRTKKDAPCQLHLGTMLLDKSYATDLKGKKVLLWDDVVKWGNTSEAARNLLLLAGAASVDVISAFSTGPIKRCTVYALADTVDDSVLFNGVSVVPSVDNFVLERTFNTGKELMEWEEDAEDCLKDWHDELGEWVKKGWPVFVPNDIPF